MCRKITTLRDKIEKETELDIVNTDIWWTLIVIHKESGRKVSLRYNSLWVEYMKIGNVLFKYNERTLIRYLRFNY